MLKGLVLTPPVLGRISIGKVVERNGKRLPQKDDEFTITTQVQNKGEWVIHPIDEKLRQNQLKVENNITNNTSLAKSNQKLRKIPIQLLFDDPDLNLRAQYSLFDKSNGRPLCVGNGETCKRVNKGQLETLPCPTPDVCPLGANHQCKPYGRLNVRIGEDDELGSFVFRTTGFNSIRTIAARLRYYHAVSNGHLATLPLQLQLRSKSTTQSHRTAIYYVDVVIRDGMTLNEAIKVAAEQHQQRLNAGFNQTALDEVAKLGFAAGAFEDNEEDGLSVVEEFYPEAVTDLDNQTNKTNSNSSNVITSNKNSSTNKPNQAIQQPTLADKLASKAQQLTATTQVN